MWKYYDEKTNVWVIDSYQNIINKFEGFIGPQIFKV